MVMTLPHLRVVNSLINIEPRLESQGSSSMTGLMPQQDHATILAPNPNQVPDNPAQILRALSELGNQASRLTPSMLNIISGSFENPADVLKVHLIEGLKPLAPIEPDEINHDDSYDAIAPVKEADVLDEQTPSPQSSLENLNDQTHPLWPKAARFIVNALRKENEALRLQIDELHLRLLSAQEVADTDVLTPTLNRRAFIREVQRALADCRRYNEEAAIIFLDLDAFKSINDEYGHAAGDKALIYVSHLLKESVREGDSVGRLGGDEFAILLRRADSNSARLKAMKLEAELMHGSFEHQKLYLKVGGSFGVRAYAGQPTAEIWIDEADAAMFMVKKPSART
jgi:diguanylate cyclase (GGDEF)-like protein